MTLAAATGFVQPDAARIPRSTLRSLLRLTGGDPGAVRVRTRDEHSNDVAEMRFPDGRVLMVKRGRHDWSRARFDASRRAAGRMKAAGVVAPDPLPLPEGMDPRPVEAYWRIPLPTLLERWPALDPARRDASLRSLGALLRRLHGIDADGHGPAGEAAAGRTLEAHLEADVRGRLLPAVWGVWPEAGPWLEVLAGAIPRVSALHADAGPVLAHGDVHLGNVLCRPEDDGTVACVGLLDLESAAGALREAELAVLSAAHGPLFHAPLPPGWFARVTEGYGASPEPLAFRFHRALHLANTGFFSALVGHAEHAALVAEAFRADVKALDAA